jgi:hypothetical protein
MSETMPHVAFSACGNTRENVTRAEAKDIPLISQAKVVKAGVVRPIARKPFNFIGARQKRP